MKKLIVSTTLASMMVAGAAQAGPHRYNDYAKVTYVNPITRTIEHKTPHRECYIEQVAYEAPAKRQHKSATPLIVGAILGGALGKEIGRRNNHSSVDATTAIGAVLGGSIGYDVGSRSRGGSYRTETHYREEERCHVTHDISYEEKIIGYDVSYRYNGQTYTTRMDYDPGDRIPVEVNVRPGKRGKHHKNW